MLLLLFTSSTRSCVSYIACLTLFWNECKAWKASFDVLKRFQQQMLDRGAGDCDGFYRTSITCLQYDVLLDISSGPLCYDGKPVLSRLCIGEGAAMLVARHHYKAEYTPMRTK